MGFLAFDDEFAEIPIELHQLAVGGEVSLDACGLNPFLHGSEQLRVVAGHGAAFLCAGRGFIEIRSCLLFGQGLVKR